MKTPFFLKQKLSLRKNCPNTKLFLVRIFKINLRIQSEYRKIRTRNNSVLDTFHAVVGICYKYISLLDKKEIAGKDHYIPSHEKADNQIFSMPLLLKPKTILLLEVQIVLHLCLYFVKQNRLILNRNS